MDPAFVSYIVSKQSRKKAPDELVGVCVVLAMPLPWVLYGPI